MNAYELADEFDWMTEEKIVQWCNDVVNMLRQQADRIAELEKCLFQMQNACIDLTKQNSEPVAWIDPKELQDPELTSTAVSKNKMYPQDIPLYTTPRELSDEEIEKLQAEHTEKGHFADTLNVKDFARAILKKASEK